MYKPFPIYANLPLKILRKSQKRHTFHMKKISIKPSCLSTRSTRVCSFSSEVLLHNLSYSDIFMYSVYKNFIIIQLPSLVLYRVMRLSIKQMAYYLLLSGIIQCYIDIFKIYLNSS